METRCKLTTHCGKTRTARLAMLSRIPVDLRIQCLLCRFFVFTSGTSPKSSLDRFGLQRFSYGCFCVVILMCLEINSEEVTGVRLCRSSDRAPQYVVLVQLWGLYNIVSVSLLCYKKLLKALVFFFHHKLYNYLTLSPRPPPAVGQLAIHFT